MGNFTYLCLRRPPGPGAIPMMNLTGTCDFGRKMRVECTDGKEIWAWGTVIYSKPLTKKQIEDFELSERVFTKGVLME